MASRHALKCADVVGHDVVVRAPRAAAAKSTARGVGTNDAQRRRRGAAMPPLFCRDVLAFAGRPAPMLLLPPISASARFVRRAVAAMARVFAQNKEARAVSALVRAARAVERAVPMRARTRFDRERARCRESACRVGGGARSATAWRQEMFMRSAAERRGA